MLSYVDSTVVVLVVAVLVGDERGADDECCVDSERTYASACLSLVCLPALRMDLLAADDLPRVPGRDCQGGHAQVGGRFISSEGQDRARYHSRCLAARPGSIMMARTHYSNLSIPKKKFSFDVHPSVLLGLKRECARMPTAAPFIRTPS